MRIEGEENLMLENELFTLDQKWQKAFRVICKEEYVPIHRIRQFICLIRKFTKQIDSLRVSAENQCLFADDILHDIEAITETFEVLDHFIQRHLDLSKEDVLLYTALKGDIEDSLLRLLYIGEEATIEDGMMIVFCIPIP